MQVISSTATFIFNPIMNILSKKDQIEVALKEEYPSLSASPIPDNIPPEIPRITAVSHHGFSNLLISTNSIQFVTRFDDSFNKDWSNKCKPYIKEHVSSIFNTVYPLFSKMLYCGLTLNIIQETTDLSVDVINKNQLKQKYISNIPLYDVEMKQAFKYLDKYYVNLLLRNQRVNPLNQKQVNILSKIENDKLMGIVLDVNDRYAANYQNCYTSTIESYNHISSIVDDIVCHKIDDFINNGGFEL